MRSLSGNGLVSDGRETWVIVQDEHLTFENQRLVGQLRARQTPRREIRVDDRIAVVSHGAKQNSEVRGRETARVGIRMVREWSAIALVMACRIHHIA